jgi:hypothetical protein
MTPTRVRPSATNASRDRFDQTVADFAETYVDLDEADFSWLQSAARKGLVRVKAES